MSSQSTDIIVKVEMGGCFSEHKQMIAPATQPTSTRNFRSSAIDITIPNIRHIFQKPTCPVENGLITESFYKACLRMKENQLEESLLSSKWKKIQVKGYPSPTLYGICQWKSPEDFTINGKGLIFNKQPKKQFLLGGTFADGHIVAGENYFIVLQNGSHYIGQISSQLIPQGKGEIFISEQENYSGDFANGAPNGTGVKHFKGRTLEGRFINGELVEGRKISNNGTYEGQFNNGMMHGRGILRTLNGLRYEGDFKMNKKHGWGKLYNSEQQLVYDGQWKDDQMVLKQRAS